MSAESSFNTESPIHKSIGGKLILRMLGLVVSLGLVIAAVFFVTQNLDDVEQALTALRNPSWLHVGGLCAAIVVNIILTGCMFSVLMSRYGKVGLIEMQALIASTALLNYLPMRPGLLGRVAYHKVINNIKVADSTKVVIYSLILSAVAAGLVACVIAIAVVAGASTLLLFGIVIALTGATAIVPTLRYWSLALFFKQLDIIAWSVRYLLVFELIDNAIGFDTALALACISMFTTMVPFISNGLGLREWAVGLSTPILAVEVGSKIAITADLVNQIGRAHV